MFILPISFAFCLFGRVVRTEEPYTDRFDYEYKVLEKLINYGEDIKTLKTKLQDVTQEIQQLKFHSVSGSYTRWGRSSCPVGATLVYDGFAAGSHYTHTGAAANYLCLSRDPKWDDHSENPSSYSLVYGAEYQTSGSIWAKLNDQEVPCAVCRVPRSNVLMMPGRNECYQNFTLEYSGYLMSGHHTQVASTEFVCVDGEAEAAPCSSSADENGKLFYFVQAECGSLKCPPYEKGKEITCAVCSL